MQFQEVMKRLRSFEVPAGWKGSIFLLPEAATREIYDFLARRRGSWIELGTGFGATTCVMAAAAEEAGGPPVCTVDMIRHAPVNVEVVSEFVGLRGHLEIVVDPLGYNWHLAERLLEAAQKGGQPETFDFCLLDGAHEFLPDALAFTLAAKLLRPGATIVLDDINFHLRQVPDWQESFSSRSDRELDTEQVRMVWDLLVRRHPDFTDFRLTQAGRLGWARKRRRPFWSFAS